MPSEAYAIDAQPINRLLDGTRNPWRLKACNLNTPAAIHHRSNRIGQHNGRVADDSPPVSRMQRALAKEARQFNEGSSARPEEKCGDFL
ncbi:hypothetical protein X961_4887 [Burkholderia pseudomallei MSHR5613]|nr:hypothetical protein X961_4887 [Burkholderia pseudomallei MSHR5613]